MCLSKVGRPRTVRDSCFISSSDQYMLNTNKQEIKKGSTSCWLNISWQCGHSGCSTALPSYAVSVNENMYGKGILNLKLLTLDSSVGRAVDCSEAQSSIGHWFDSGSRDRFFPDGHIINKILCLYTLIFILLPVSSVYEYAVTSCHWRKRVIVKC